MRYPKCYKTPLPEHLEAERVRLTDMLLKIYRSWLSVKNKPIPDAALVDEYNAAVKKFNEEVRPVNSAKEMISLDYNGQWAGH